MSKLTTLLSSTPAPEALSAEEITLREKLRVAQAKRFRRITTARQLATLAQTLREALAKLENEAAPTSQKLTEAQLKECFCEETTAEMGKVKQSLRDLIALVS
jgi:hypothetical protein